MIGVTPVLAIAACKVRGLAVILPATEDAWMSAYYCDIAS